MAVRMPQPGDTAREVKMNRLEAEARDLRVRVRDLEAALSQARSRLSGRPVPVSSSALSGGEEFLVDAAITIKAESQEQAASWAKAWATELRPSVKGVHVCQVEPVPDYPSAA